MYTCYITFIKQNNQKNTLICDFYNYIILFYQILNKIGNFFRSYLLCRNTRHEIANNVELLQIVLID
jgi:hypothetical protein